jgi:hypothetical protein
LGKIHTNGAEKGGGLGIQKISNFGKSGVHDSELIGLNTNLTRSVYYYACAKLPVLYKVTRYFLIAKGPSTKLTAHLVTCQIPKLRMSGAIILFLYTS